jgi:hypothetical protein
MISLSIYSFITNHTTNNIALLPNKTLYNSNYYLLLKDTFEKNAI